MAASKGIFKNVLVPIPQDAYVIKSTAQVFQVASSVYHPEKGYATTSKLFIGKAVSETSMHPNVNYALKYPGSFREAAGEDVPCQEVHAGMYAATLGIVTGSGMYHDMVSTLGPENANAVLDFAMYSILARSSAAMNYSGTMENKMLFSESLWDGSKWSGFFNEGLTENQALLFRKAWLLRCKANGETDCWICIDGSNSEHNARKSAYREQGNSKTHRNTGIVGYMYAVSAATGIPVTYAVYRGSRPDCTEVFELITLLQSHGIKPKGVVLDRGFGGSGIAEALGKAGIPFIVMLEQGDSGTKEMISRHGEEIRTDYESYVPGTLRTYGRIGKCKAYKNDAEESHIALFYDSTNGTARVNHLHEMVHMAQETVEKAILKNRKAPAVRYGQFLKVEKDAGGNPVSCTVNLGKLKGEAAKKGFSAMRLSEDFGIAEAHRIYTLRQKSEKQFAMFKTQLGYNVMRNHFTSGVTAKSCVGFVSSIVRCSIMNAADKAGLETNPAIKELDHLHVGCYAGGEYIYCHTESEKTLALLGNCGVSRDNLEGLAADLNERRGEAIVNPVRTLRETGAKKERKGPGRPKGSKNKAGKEKPGGEKPKARRGRPPGSKNKKTIEREATEKREAEEKNRVE